MKRTDANRRFRNSLTSKYLLIIGIAMLFMPIIFPMASILYWFINDGIWQPSPSLNDKYPNGTVLDQMWHQEAKSLASAPPEQVDKRLQALKQEYPEMAMFWVDDTDQTRLMLPEQEKLPKKWTPAASIQFMKAAYNSDPFTVVAYIGDDEKLGKGFMVMELPRAYIRPKQILASDTTVYSVFVFIMSGLFILISWLFFARIRKRLIRLKEAMISPDLDSGIPRSVMMTKPDEIGQLEQGYNDMVAQLEQGRRRQLEEEELRKSLIANLSHDLRTPLTVIRGHLHALDAESLSEQGRDSVARIETKITDLSELIDNLLSYSLLTSGRVELKREACNVLRLVKESAAAWYPIWEKEGIEADIDLQNEPLIWQIDALWFRRVLDNLFQNVVRHARSGCYIGIHTETREHAHEVSLVITDRGPGMFSTSSSKGTGIGLAVVEMLTKEMELDCTIVSSESGTAVKLTRSS